jgi:hypothetical protein
MKMWGNGYLCPWCEHAAARPKTDTEPDTDDANPRSDDDESGSTALTSKEIRRHYEKTIDTYRKLGELSSGAASLAVVGNFGWYHYWEGSGHPTKPHWRGRAKPLSVEAPRLSAEVGTTGVDRTVYATANYYAPEAIKTARCYGVTCKPPNVGWVNADKKREWGTEGGDNPLPEYADHEGIALYSDFDLADKERPLSDADRRTVEMALKAICAVMGDELADDRNAVFLLDSGGGAYPMLAPSVSAPIAEHFDGDERARLFEALCDRFNTWLSNAFESLCERVDGAADVFDPDDVMNKNRQYKAPLSIHKRLNHVVRPMDPANPEYRTCPVSDVTPELVTEAERWADELTTSDFADGVDSLVAALWPDEHAGADSWHDALQSWLDADDERASNRDERQKEARERRRERGRAIEDVETTREIADVYEAVEAIDVRDVAREYETETRNKLRFAAPWHESHDSGTSCFADRDKFVDLTEPDGMKGGDALMLAALIDGIVDPADGYPGGADYIEALDSLRDRGHHVPEVEPGPWRREVLLPADVAPPKVEPPESLELQAVRDKTKRTIAEAMRVSDSSLIDGLMTTGKSHGFVLAAADSHTPATMLTIRGREEQYDDLAQKARGAELSVVVMPSAPESCPCFTDKQNDEHGRVWSLYNDGAAANEIHRRLELHGDGETCEYKAALDALEYSEVDLILGHHSHAYAIPVVSGRVTAIDEFDPSAYETNFGSEKDASADDTDIDAAIAGIDTYLADTDELPFASKDDLLSERHDDEKTAAALEWFADEFDGEYRDSDLPFDGTHALAPAVVYTLLAAEKLGNGFERADLPRGVGVYDRENSEVHLLRPPDLTYASTVLALDGTPTEAMWRAALGIDISVQHERYGGVLGNVIRPFNTRVLTNDERRKYVRRTLRHRYIRTTDALKPYSGGSVNVEQDAALIEAIRDEHGAKPSLITSRRAQSKYERDGVLENVGEHAYYGNLKGSNKLKSERLGIVVGSPHFGDSFVKKWGAYIGDGVEVTGGDGEPREYSGVGRQIAAHMTENQVLQAMMRFGRDGGGATVYVHTRAVPSWVPIENAPGVISFRGDDDGRTDGEHGIKQVWRYALENDEFARSDASEAVDVSERTVKRALKELVENGALEKEWSGGRNVYSVADEGYNVAAEVDLTPDRRPWSSLEN